MTRSERFGERLVELCRARLPFVYVRTWEEERLLSQLVDVADSMTPTRRLFVWGAVTGLASRDEAAQSGSATAMGVLEAIERHDGPAIFALKDFHVLLRSRGRDETELVIRKMRDLVVSLKRSSKTVVIVAPLLVLPEELQKDVAVLDFELPGADEIRASLDRLIERNCKNGRIVNALDEEGLERLVKAALGLTLNEAETAFARAMVDDDRLDTNDIRVVQSEKRQIIARTEILEYVADVEGFDAVGGLENLKRWLYKRDGSWLDPARRYCLPFPKGLLITGVPGCGKSLTAKCTSAVWQLPLLRLDVGRVFSSLLGGSEERMRAALQTAEAIAPCILLIDEIEKGFGGATGPSLDSGTSSRVFGTFLTWMQEKQHPVFVMATANAIDRLPAEFLRKGRFDEIFFVDLPTESERRRIIEIHLEKRLQYPEARGDLELNDELYEKLTAVTEGFSGAEIEQLVISALFDAYAESRSLELDDLLRAVHNTVPLSATQAEQIELIRTWASERAVSATSRDDRSMGHEALAAAGQPGPVSAGREIEF